MAVWEKTQAYHDILGFINGISTSIQGKKLSAIVEASPIAEAVANIFVKLNALLDETPPCDQPQRFGNKSYRDWYQKLKENATPILEDALPNELHDAIPEVIVYFIESFGNATRIDYGTGHELAFIMFLCALYKIKALTESDNVYTGLRIFNAYLTFVRRLQLTYRMEPAGSHGVWSLDDYQFVPFIWGSAQLAGNCICIFTFRIYQIFTICFLYSQWTASSNHISLLRKISSRNINRIIFLSDALITSSR